MKTAQTQVPQPPTRAPAGHDKSAAAVVGSFLSRKWQQIQAVCWVLVALLVIGVAIAVVRQWRQAKIGQGFAEVKKADTVETLDVIAEAQAGTRVGELASLKTAHRLYEEGKYEQAAARFAQFTQKYPDSPAATGARLGEAYALETAGKQKEAGQQFAAIAKLGGDSAGARDAMCGAARCALAQGLLGEAETWYKQAKDLPDTSPMDKDRIEQALKDLAAKRAANPVAAAATEGVVPAAATEPVKPDGDAAATPPASAK
ncbi:MAG: hypothetical protein A3K19_11245 [Lentisphaerae bacterium RIFOXYB12_FULL_65_16]|nr:MAG: hypothetical protein A3K18_25185 [Lentisphaerae bacterium RIFOXYA12_64_32]OGV90144.1 MAG: hypothetical protein A3K19_11245 [Lentisphaerae bacterium RIFOXYB12_FULL_65_16]